MADAEPMKPLVVLPHISGTILPYSAMFGCTLAIIFSCFVIYFAGKYDKTGGPLTVSILFIVTFMGVITYCLIYTIPQDPTTATMSGALAAAVGAIVAYWFAKDHGRTDTRPPS